jgi:hypothetical protein
MIDTITGFADTCIIIKIRPETVWKTGSVYKAVRNCWRANLYSAMLADYVLAVVEGVVVGVFKPTEWYYVDDEECKKINCGRNGPCGRIAFNGTEAPIDAQNNYLNKYIPYEYRKPGMAAPFLYAYH